jgi:hypothetical protein
MKAAGEHAGEGPRAGAEAPIAAKPDRADGAGVEGRVLRDIGAAESDGTADEPLLRRPTCMERDEDRNQRKTRTFPITVAQKPHGEAQDLSD